MKTNCEPFLAEIAACASAAAELSTDAAAHVANCARCRERMAEFKGITSIHREAAAQLAEPKLRLSRGRLQDALAGGGWSRSEIHWRPVLAGVLTLAFVVGATLNYRSPRGTSEARPQAKRVPSEIKSPNALEPTLLTLHYEVENGREPILAGVPGASLRHYRLKDVAREL